LTPWCGWLERQEICGEIRICVLPAKDRCDWIKVMKEQITGGNWRGRGTGRLVGALGLLLALVLLVGVAPAYAQDGEMPPQLPHYFAGTVSTSNGPVGEGTAVEAYLDGVKDAETVVTARSTYELLVPGEYGDEGKTVTFEVGGVEASETATWTAGKIDTNFDLTIASSDSWWPFPFARPSFCFIATAAYGTDTAEEINILRQFRDVVLLPSGLGAEFVSLYYEVSPPIAEVISQHDFLRTAVRVGFIDPIVAILDWSHALWAETD
jgi:hypothetical protein